MHPAGLRMCGRFPMISETASRLRAASLVIDGEAVMGRTATLRLHGFSQPGLLRLANIHPSATLPNPRARMCLRLLCWPTFPHRLHS